MTTPGKSLRAYFLGSGSIAVPLLAALRADPRIELRGAGTQPDRPSGRRRQVTPTPVAAWCEDAGLEADKIESVRAEGFLRHLQALAPSVVVVFAFGQILPPVVLEWPRLGCINVHASLLPRYRGAAPVAAAIRDGVERSGISFMQMEPGLDTGPVYEQFAVGLNGDEYAPDLEARLAELAAEHAADVLVRIAAGESTPAPQDESAVSVARKIKKSHGQIDWMLPAAAIERRVRAYYPWPGAWFRLSAGKQPKVLTVTRASVDPDATAPPGTVLEASKHAWKVAAGEGGLCLERVVPAGKKEMSGPAFLRGCPLPEGSSM